jgi:hypothetical protein
VTVTDKPAPANPITLFIRITQARWWRFFRPVDGVLRLEIPPGTTLPPRAEVFAIKVIGSYLNLHRWPKAEEIPDLTKSPEGQFYAISNPPLLMLRLTDDEQFQGRCTKK